MAVEVQAVHSINIAFPAIELIRTDAEIDRCTTETGGEVIPHLFLATGQGAPGPQMGRVLQVPQDRLKLETSAQLTQAKREYPSTIDDIASVARLMAHAIDCTDLDGMTPPAFGFNIEMVYDQGSGDTAYEYLGRRIFSSVRQVSERWGKAGVSGKIFFEEDTAQWTITLEPRLQSHTTTKIFLAINLHISEARLPDEKEMNSRMRILWDQAHSLIETIDGSINE